MTLEEEMQDIRAEYLDWKTPFLVFNAPSVKIHHWRPGSRLMLKEGLYGGTRNLVLLPLTHDEALQLLTHRLGTPERAKTCLSCLPDDERLYNPIQFMPLDLLGIAALWERDGEIPVSVKERHRRLCRLHLSQSVPPEDIPVAEDILRALWPAYEHEDWLKLSEVVRITRDALEPHGQHDAAASWLGSLTRPDGVLISDMRGVRPRYPHLVRALVLR